MKTDKTLIEDIKEAYGTEQIELLFIYMKTVKTRITSLVNENTLKIFLFAILIKDYTRYF